MAVIRKKQISRNQPHLFSYRDAEEEAKRTVELARVSAESVTAAARVDGFEDGRREGFEAGLREGRAAGLAKALEDHTQNLEAAAQALKNAAQQFDQAKSNFTAEALQDCVDLALAVARRITKRQAQVDPHVLSANLEQAMKMAIGCTRLRIAFHPDDRATITQVLERLRFSNQAVESAQIIEDPTLARGGCRIDTEHGVVDADINAQLDRLIAELMPMTRPPPAHQSTQRQSPAPQSAQQQSPPPECST